MSGDYSRYRFRQEMHYCKVNKQQGRVDLDADYNEQNDIDAHYQRTSLADTIGQNGAPYDNAGFKIGVVAGSKDFTISAGRYYVDGILCENEQDVKALNQPSLPLDAEGSNPALSSVTAAGKYLAYLDVYEQEITAIDDPQIKDPALNGADTTTRTKIVWQVKTSPVNDNTCPTQDSLLEIINSQSSGSLQAKTNPADVVNSPCQLPPDSKYKGLQNQLYRIEIHDSGNDGQATFKWSRNNGALVAAVNNINGDQIEIDDRGGNSLIGFTNNTRWIEVTDERHQLWGLPGVIVPLDRVVGNKLVVGSGKIADVNLEFPVQSNLKVKGWDCPPDKAPILIPAGNDTWIKIENGLEILFGAGFYNTGDFWTIPARVGLDIEWPPLGVNQTCPPQGIKHHYASLAILNFDGSNFTNGKDDITDCRELFPPLNDLDSFFYLGGDAQQGRPGSRLSFPLLTGVARGEMPLAGVQVTFTILSGSDGSLQTVDGRGTWDGKTFTITTDAQGLAQCYWILASKDPQKVRATMHDEDGHVTHLPIFFSAKIDTSGQGSCSFTASPTDDLSKLISNLPQHGGKICLRSGYFYLKEPIVVKKRQNILIQGAGPSTKIVINGFESAFIFENCANITIDRLWAEAVNSTTKKTKTLASKIQSFKSQVLNFIGKQPKDSLPTATQAQIQKMFAQIPRDHLPSSLQKQIQNMFGQLPIESLPAATQAQIRKILTLLSEISLTPAAARVQRTKRSVPNTNGVLNFVNCKEITVTNSTFVCSRGNIKDQSCLTFYGTESLPTTQIEVRDCDFLVGSLQVGVSVINGEDVSIRNNYFRVKPFVGKKIIIKKSDLSQTHWFRTIVRVLAENVPNVPRPPASSNTRDTIFYYRTLAYAAYVGIMKKPMLGKMENMAFNDSEIRLIYKIKQDLSVGFQGIVFGGSRGNNLRIYNNTIKGMIQGIHLGLSVEDINKLNTKQFKDLSVFENKIELDIPVWFTEEKHGIFVGNADNASIRDNDVTIRKINHVGIRMYPKFFETEMFEAAADKPPAGNTAPQAPAQEINLDQPPAKVAASLQQNRIVTMPFTDNSQNYLWNRNASSQFSTFGIGLETMVDFGEPQDQFVGGMKVTKAPAAVDNAAKIAPAPPVQVPTKDLKVATLATDATQPSGSDKSQVTTFGKIPTIEGIKAYGHMGKRVAISSNTVTLVPDDIASKVIGIRFHIPKFPIKLQAVQSSGVPSGGPLWIIRENIVVGATVTRKGNYSYWYKDSENSQWIKFSGEDNIPDQAL